MTDVIADLKSEYINKFDCFRKSLYKGVCHDYSVLKHMAIVINNSDYFSNKILEYLITRV